VGRTEEDSRSIGGLERHRKTRAAGEDTRSRGGQEKQVRTCKKARTWPGRKQCCPKQSNCPRFRNKKAEDFTGRKNVLMVKMKRSRVFHRSQKKFP
jgi:hypothetical protein